MNFRILLSNDDGIDAPGLGSLYEEISRIADLTVVAPTTERSATGHAISVYNDLTLVERKKDGRIWGYGLEGTPADCVKFAISKLMPAPPHLVISGINLGQNTGNSILYSGTVAAAIEATMYGIPAMAVSIATFDLENACFNTAARFAADLVQILLKKDLSGEVLLNVNIPNVPEDQIRGVVISRQGKSMFQDLFEHQGEINGLPAFRNIGSSMVPSPDEEDFDDIVLSQNKISITPLQYDLTHHQFRNELDRWIRGKLKSGLFNYEDRNSHPRL